MYTPNNICEILLKIDFLSRLAKISCKQVLVNSFQWICWDSLQNIQDGSLLRLNVSYCIFFQYQFVGLLERWRCNYISTAVYFNASGLQAFDGAALLRKMLIPSSTLCAFFLLNIHQNMLWQALYTQGVV